MKQTQFQMSFGVTGDDRKRLVKAMSEYLNTISEYAGAPTFAYTVGDYTIDKEGTISAEEVETDELDGLMAYLAGCGFTTEEEEESAEEAAPEAEPEEEPEILEDEPAEDTLTVEVPNDFTEEALSNLRKMVASKASLLKKSFGAEELPIEVTDEKVSFPWFTDTDPMKVTTYTRFIAMLCKAAKEAKRVIATDHEVESEKYALRTWLLRLGFIGAEFKNDRAILMENLSGTAAFKNAADARAFAEKQKAKKAALKAEAAATAAPAEEEAEDEIS